MPSSNATSIASITWRPGWGSWCNPNYSDELANGVAVSFDPVRGEDGRYYVGTVKLSSLAAFSPPAATAKSLILSL